MKSKMIGTIFVAIMMMSTMSIASAVTLGLTTKNTATWDETDVATATLTYNEAGAEFVYELDGNVPLVETEYTLIYYADAEPTGTSESFVNPGIVGKRIAVATSDSNGVIHMEGSEVMDSIPYAEDANSLPDSNGGNPGAKIWLVPTTDIVDGINWADMTNFLYEENMVGAIKGVPSHLITYTFVLPESVDVHTQVDIQECPESSIGISTDGEGVVFSDVYIGETSTTASFVLAIGAEGYLPEERGDCQASPDTVEVTFNIGDWNNEGGVMTTSVVGGSVQNLPVGGNSVELVLSLEDVPAGEYQQTITVTAVY